jgi:hypothetical protein
MGEQKRRTAPGRLRVVPYPAPESDKCQRLMVGVIKALGSLPTDDDGIVDRVRACFMVAVGELATMRDTKRRDEIVNSLSPAGKAIIEDVIARARETEEMAATKGQSVAQMLNEAVEEGVAEELPLPKTPTEH